MKINLNALGCRLNEAELEQWSQAFQASGHRIVAETDQADWVVVNTCSVTQDAGRKSRKLINRLYRQNPSAKLIATGCHASLQPEQVAENLGVDLVIPNQEKDQLATTVMQAFAAPTMPDSATEPGETALFTRGRQRAFIKIQDGCRYRCSFCIVTVARGDERSRTPQAIIQEINRLTEQGVKEIVLTGVHVGGYGSDLSTNLFALVKQILAETDVPRLRFASVEPWDLPDDFFSLFANPRVMPHMHLPLQSGSDSVLRRMSRRCKTAEFARLVEYAREQVPNFNVTTDIIVGFPNETEQEWQDSLAFVEQIGFGHIHIFAYSPREGTKAARLPNPVPHDIKKQRSQVMHELAAKLRQAALQTQLTQTVDVLWEKAQPVNPHNPLGQVRVNGYTPNFFKVSTTVAATKLLENKITATNITAIDETDLRLIGELH